MELETEIAAFSLAALEKDQRLGVPSGFGCPDCSGVLWELHEGELIRFRCRVGHAWSPSSLLAEQSETLETALWDGVARLEERRAVGRLADRLATRGIAHSSARFRAQAEEAKGRATLIRKAILSGEPKAEIEAEERTERDQGERPRAKGTAE